ARVRPARAVVGSAGGAGHLAARVPPAGRRDRRQVPSQPLVPLVGTGGAAAPPVPACCSRSPVDRPGSCLASFGTPLEKRRGRTQHFGLPGISGELARLARIPRPRPRAGLSLRTRAVMVP